MTATQTAPPASTGTDTEQTGTAAYGLAEASQRSSIYLDGGPCTGWDTYHHLDPVIAVPGLLPGRLGVYVLDGVVLKPNGFYSVPVRRFRWKGWTSDRREVQNG